MTVHTILFRRLDDLVTRYEIHLVEVAIEPSGGNSMRTIKVEYAFTHRGAKRIGCRLLRHYHKGYLDKQREESSFLPLEAVIDDEARG